MIIWHVTKVIQSGNVQCLNQFVGFSINLFIHSAKSSLFSFSRLTPKLSPNIQPGLLYIGSFLCCTAIALCLLPQSASAQLPVFECRPNASGDGWICDSTDGSPLPNTANGANQYNSDNAVLPGPVPAAEPEPNLDTESGGESTDDSLPSETQPQQTGPGSTPSSTSSASTNSGNSTTPEPIRAAVSRYPLDWVPIEAMTEEQRQALDGNCCGGFVDPLQNQDESAAETEISETRYQSASGPQQISQSLISIDGDVIVQQGSSSLRTTI